MNFAGKLRSFLFGSIARKYWLAVGLILAIAGQSLMREPQALTSFKTITDITINWNKEFYFGLKNPANIMVGLFLIAIAAIIYARLFISSGELKNLQQPYPSNETWASLKKFSPWIALALSVYALVMLQIASHRSASFLLWIWLLCIFVFTFILWKNENQNKAVSIFSISRIDGAWMLILFAFAIAAGSYLLNDMPAGWVADEGAFWKMARSIAIGEINPSFFDFGVFTFPAGGSILQGWIMRWSGINLWGWRFASLLPAAMTVIPLYLLALELFDRRVAIAANVMMIANPYFLLFARLGYNNSQSLLPATLCIYFLVLGFRKNSRFYLWLAGVTAGFGFYTYFAAWLGLVVIVIVILALPLMYSVKFKKSILPLTIVTVGVLAVFLPRLLYSMSGETPILLYYKIWETGPINTFYGYSVFGEERMAQANILMLDDQVGIFYDLSLYGVLLLRGLILSAAVLFDPIGYIDHQIIFGLAGPGASIFFILGLGVTLANFRKLQYIIPSIWFLAGFFFLGVLASLPPRPTHMVAIIPVLAMISGIGLISFLDAVVSENSSKLEKTFRWKNTARTCILLMISMMGFFQFFFLTPYFYYPPNQDDYISWLGRQVPASAKLILVDHYATTRNPRNESLIKLIQYPVLFKTHANIESNPDQLKTWTNFVAFIDRRNGQEYAELLAKQIPNATMQIAYAPGKRFRGYVISDLQINTTMSFSLPYGLQDLWGSPARGILLFCGAGVIALLLMDMRRVPISRPELELN